MALGLVGSLWEWWPEWAWARLAELRRDLRDEAVEITAELEQRTEHRRDEYRVHSRRLNLAQPLANLFRGAGQEGIVRIRNVIADAVARGIF